MQAVVIAGGLGTRLGGEDAMRPKCLAPLDGAPVLDHALRSLRDHGVDDVVLCLGYRAEQVVRWLAETTYDGLRVRCSIEPVPRGTAGALREASHLFASRFVVLLGDVVADVDLARMVAVHADVRATATLAVHPNDHPRDSDRVVADRSGRVLRFVSPGADAWVADGSLCVAGIYVLEREALHAVPVDVPCDLSRELLPSLVTCGARVAAWRTAEYARDMGTPTRRASVEADVRAGLPRSLRRDAPKAAVFVDRDGVLIEDVGHLSRPSDLRVLPGVAPALRRLNAARVPVVCVTNQPVVARGTIDEDELHAIHRQLEGLLGASGAWLDAIYACHHHPEAGFDGERSDLKRACACRKPQPGMLFDAARDLGIDLTRSLFVGDRPCDALAARAAGVRFAGTSATRGLADVVAAAYADGTLS